MTVLRITTRTDGQATIVDLAGELNLATAPDLAAHLGRLLREGPRQLIFDLSRLDACDAAGLHSLYSGLVRVRMAGGTACLVDPDERFVYLVDPPLKLTVQRGVAEALTHLQAVSAPPGQPSVAAL